jgi:hypothetical protein
MDKQNLIDEINTRISFCIGDANTFIWAKSQADFNKLTDVGGGNYSVLLTSFSVLDFLSYMNGFLNDLPLVDDSDIQLFNTIKQAMKTQGIDTKYLQSAPKKGELKLNGRDLVEALLLETASLTGIKKDNIDILWQTRHKLTHEYNPKFIPAGSISLGQNYEDMKKALKNRPIIDKSTDGIDCINVHALNYKLAEVASSIINKITNADKHIIDNIVDCKIFK